MKRKQTTLVVLIALAVLLLGAAALLIRGISRFRDVSGQLNLSRHQLNVLYRRNPFPSEENIGMEMEHLQKLRQELTELIADLADGQVEPVQTAPLRFVEMFRETTRRLTDRAEEVDVSLPSEFAFGFQRHRAGVLPNPADVPRLIQQLAIIEQLANVLYEARVNAIRAVERQAFESSDTLATAPAPGVPRGGLWGDAAPTPVADQQRESPLKVGLLTDDAIYASMRFTLEFTARENALLTVLNQLAAHRMFIIINQVDLDNRFVWNPVRATPADPAAAAAAAAPAMAAARHARVATGMEQPFNVKIDLEVYRFRKDNPL